MAVRETYIRLSLMVASVLAATNALAISNTTLFMESLEGGQWQAHRIRIHSQLASATPAADITVGSLRLQGVAEPVSNLRIHCPRVVASAKEFACQHAQITGQFPFVGQQQFTASAAYQRNNDDLSVSARQLRIGDAPASAEVKLDAHGWQASGELQHASLAALLQLAKQLGFVLDGSLAPDPSQLSGTLSATLHARGTGAQPDEVQWQLDAGPITLGNSAGTLATDQWVMATQGSARHQQDQWLLSASLTSNAGQVYAQPVFVDFAQQALEARLEGSWQANQSLHLSDLTVVQQGVGQFRASGLLQNATGNPVPTLQLDINTLQFPGSFATYLQPFLVDTSLKNLATQGSLEGRVIIRDSQPVQADIRIHELHADTGNGQLSFSGVAGDVHWRDALTDNEATPRSTLHWDSGSLLGLQLGAATLPLELWSNTLRFAEPARIPVFNGALAVEALRIRKLGTPQMAFLLDAHIEPISVAQLSRGFGWPEFGGELSGTITKLRLEDGVLSLDSTLTAQVFDGNIRLSDLKLEGALTDWPRFSANIALERLNLEQLTQAFSFGRITGRLSGEINQLNLFNWDPVSFDARFYTPADDRSRHRISQRAVQNIGSVGGNGGGVAAALQTGFLRFFEDFNYDRLGLSCTLRNEVCLMNGIEPAGNEAYYLVKGKGLPRIDVIGNSTRVDWPRLMQQVKAVTESGGPVVQ